MKFPEYSGFSPGYVGVPEFLLDGNSLDLELAVRDCVSRAKCFRQSVAHACAQCAAVAVGSAALVLGLGSGIALAAGCVALIGLSGLDMMKRTKAKDLTAMYCRSLFVTASAVTMALLVPICVELLIRVFFGRPMDVVWIVALFAWSGLLLCSSLWYSYAFRRSYRNLVASDVMLS